MTLLEAQNKLIKLFEENDTFNLKRDFKKIVPISTNKELNDNEDQAILVAALASMESLVRKQDFGKETYYILFKPLSSYSQTVELGAGTIAAITKVINDFCDANEDKVNIVNPLNITEKDIQNLLMLTLNNTQEEVV